MEVLVIFLIIGPLGHDEAGVQFFDGPGVAGAAASSIVVSRKYPRATVVYALVIAVTIADYIASGVLAVLMLGAAVALFSRAKS